MDSGFIQLLVERARATPERLFASYEGEPLTFGALDAGSDALAVHLRRRGIVSGDRVGLMLKNSLGAVLAYFALAKAGAVVIPVNAKLRGDGLRYVLDHAQPRLLIVDGDFVGIVKESGASLNGDALLVNEPVWGLERFLHETATFDEPLPEPTSGFAISYTSGTTGEPKGVMLTHKMLRFAAEGTALAADPQPADVMLLWEPLYHIGGLQLLVVPLIREATLAMIARFSASRFWDQVRACGATHIHYLGGILQMLAHQPRRPGDRQHKVRIAWGGACPRAEWVNLEQRFGFKIRECYGMTETSSFATVNCDGLVGSVGKPVPWLEIEVRDDSGAIAKPGEVGEIVVRERQEGALFAGYFRNATATARALRDGVFYTGDMGSCDAAGNLYFHGRMTDSVRCRGENVSAWEVEHVVAQHPDVEDCAIIGVAAEVGEQDIKLFVQPKKGRSIDIPALSAWTAGRLAPYQNPRFIALVEEFQRTPSQRVMKHVLSRDRADCWDRLAETPMRSVAG